MAMVLFATQKFATVTNPPIPSRAVFFELMILLMFLNRKLIPPAFYTNAAKPPVRSESRKISVMLVKPS